MQGFSIFSPSYLGTNFVLPFFVLGCFVCIDSSTCKRSSDQQCRELDRLQRKKQIMQYYAGDFLSVHPQLDLVLYNALRAPVSVLVGFV